MWPRSAEYLYTGLEPPASHSNENSFDVYYCRMLERITACLDARLGLELPDDVRLLPAVLLFNQFDDPLWCDLGKGYGIGQTKQAIKALKEAKAILSSSEAGQFHDIQSAFEKAYEAVVMLPRPASLWLDSAYEIGHENFSAMINHLLEYYDIHLEQARQWGGNARAKRLAVRLRAITTSLTSHPVHVGDNPQVPNGVYVECLAELYEVIGIQVHFYRYASNACGNDVDKEELSKSFGFLQSISAARY